MILCPTTELLSIPISGKKCPKSRHFCLYFGCFTRLGHFRCNKKCVYIKCSSFLFWSCECPITEHSKSIQKRTNFGTFLISDASGNGTYISDVRCVRIVISNEVISLTNKGFRRHFQVNHIPSSEKG